MKFIIIIITLYKLHQGIWTACQQFPYLNNPSTPIKKKTKCRSGVWKTVGFEKKIKPVDGDS